MGQGNQGFRRPHRLKNREKDFEGSAWYGVVVPAGTPPVIVSKINGDIVRILQQSEFKDHLSNQGVDLVGSTPEQFAEFIKSEIVKWGKIVKASGARVD